MTGFFALIPVFLKQYQGFLGLFAFRKIRAKTGQSKGSFRLTSQNAHNKTLES